MARNRQGTVKQLPPPKREAVFTTVNEDGDCTGIYESVADACSGFCSGDRLFVYELSLEATPRQPRPAIVASDGTVYADYDESEEEES